MESRRPLIPASFALAFILFFFTFCEFNCGGQKIGSVKGINLVTGSQMEETSDMFGQRTQGEKVPPSIWAIIAFGCTIIGFAAFIIKAKKESAVGTVAGTIGVVSLIILQFVIKDSIDEKAQGQVQTEFKIAYWLALISLALASLLSYLGLRKVDSNSSAKSPLIFSSGEAKAFCSNCGSHIQGNAMFCSECGQSMK